MKKYYICFFVLAVLLAVAVLTGAYFYMYRPEKEGPIPNGVIESESFAGENLALNREPAVLMEGMEEPSDATVNSQAKMAAGPADAARADEMSRPAGDLGKPGTEGSGMENAGPGSSEFANAGTGSSEFGNAGTGEAAADGNAALGGTAQGPAGEIPDGEKRYCLVAEDGFLLVFAKDRNAICLDTHMPLAEFPEKEQERLMDGIWFSTMIEIFNYLESYSS